VTLPEAKLAATRAGAEAEAVILTAVIHAAIEETATITAAVEVDALVLTLPLATTGLVVGMTVETATATVMIVGIADETRTPEMAAATTMVEARLVRPLLPS
jgi:hypothetical protein